MADQAGLTSVAPYLIRHRRELEAALLAIQSEGRKIDLVCRGGIFYFVYVDDWFHSRIPAADRGFDLNRMGRRRDLLAKAGEDELLGRPTSIEVMLLEAARFDPNLTYVDVGTNYGQWVLRAWRLLQREGLKVRTICLEPGVAGRLARMNLVMNGLTDVDFWFAACSDVSSIIPIFAVEGHTEDNKIVNPDRERASCFPTLSIRLDDLLGSVDGFSSAFLKIDTQGAEPEVLRGLGRLRQADVCGVIEFTPKAVSSRVKPALFLNGLLEEFELIELDGAQNAIGPVTAASTAALVEKVWNLPIPMCDLAIVSLGHRRRRELIAACQGEAAG